MKILILGFVVVLGLSATVSAQATMPLVLNIRSFEQMPDGTFTLTLPSGARLTVLPIDIDATRTKRLLDESRSAGAGPGRGSRPFAAGPATETCTARWPTDFAMQQHCLTQQAEALEALRNRSMTTATEQTIRRTCATRWPSDYSMRDFCEETQLEAARALGR